MITALGRELGIVQAITEAVEWDEKQCFVDPGTHTLAMAIDILLGRSPLYLVEKRYAEMDVGDVNTLSDSFDKFLMIEERIVLDLDAENAVIAPGRSVIYSKKALKHLKKKGLLPPEPLNGHYALIAKTFSILLITSS